MGFCFPESPADFVAQLIRRGRGAGGTADKKPQWEAILERYRAKTVRPNLLARHKFSGLFYAAKFDRFPS